MVVADRTDRDAPKLNTGIIDTLDEIFNLDTGLLATYNLERRDPIEILGNSLISGNDPLLLGRPGTGKTHLLEMMMQCIVDEAGKRASDEEIFDILLAKDMSSDDVLGVRSLPDMKAGRVRRIIDGMLPAARAAIVDEVFKASPPLQNSMLDILARRILKVGGIVLDCRQLLLIVLASNEYPSREDLAAFKDRIVPVYVVEPVRSPESRKRIMQIQDEFQAGGMAYDTTDWPRLTLDEVAQARAEAMSIPVPEHVMDKLNEAIEKFDQAGYLPSERRFGQFLKQMKANAYRHRRDHVTPDDMIVVKDMAFSDLSERDDAYKILIEYAGVFARKAADMRTSLEPLMTSVDEMRAKINAAAGDQQKIEEALDNAYDVLRNLRRFKKEARDEISKGKGAGEDVRAMEEVMQQIVRAEDYVEKVASGAEEE